jgi:hypothetical protein
VINLPESILPTIPVPKGKTDVSVTQQQHSAAQHTPQHIAAAQAVMQHMSVPKGKTYVRETAAAQHTATQQHTTEQHMQ